MIGEIEALLDEGVDVDGPMLARTFARVQQHVLDNRIRALAVLNNLVEIIAQGVRQFGYLGERISIGFRFAESFLQFVEQFSRYTREIVDEIERVFDFVSYSSSELAERS